MPVHSTRHGQHPRRPFVVLRLAGGAELRGQRTRIGQLGCAPDDRRAAVRRLAAAARRAHLPWIEHCAIVGNARRRRDQRRGRRPGEHVAARDDLTFDPVAGVSSRRNRCRANGADGGGGVSPRITVTWPSSRKP